MRQIIIKPPSNIKVGLKESKSSHKEQNTFQGQWPALPISLPKGSLAVYYSDLSQAGTRTSFQYLSPSPDCPSGCFRTHCYAAAWAIWSGNRSVCKGTTLSGPKRGRMRRRCCFSPGLFPLPGSQHKELSWHKVGRSWHYLRYLQHRWPEIGRATPAQLSHCKLNSPTVATKATSLWSHLNRRVLKKTAIAQCPNFSRASSEVFVLWSPMEVTLLKEKFCLHHQSKYSIHEHTLKISDLCVKAIRER